MTNITIKTSHLTPSEAQQAFLNYIATQVSDYTKVASQVYWDAHIATLVDGIPRAVEFKVTESGVLQYTIIELPYKQEDTTIYGTSPLQNLIPEN